MLQPHTKSFSLKDKMQSIKTTTILPRNALKGQGLNWKSGDVDLNKSKGKAVQGFGSGIKQSVPIVPKSGKKR